MTQTSPTSRLLSRPAARIRAMVVATVAMAAVLVPVSSSHALAGSYFAGTYANAWGARYFQGYVPSTYSPGTAVPLVVVLHGCTQYAANAENLTRFDDLAQSRSFITVYPQQDRNANGSGCWNWLFTANQSRGSGEPSIIAGITSYVQSHYTIDPKRIYVTGLSAGAAMSVIMGVTYPDVYASIGVGSGCEYAGYPYCGGGGTGQNPTTQGNSAYSAMGTYKRTVPAIVFHGTADTVIAVANEDQIVSQMAQTDDRASDGIDNNNIDDIAETTINGQVPGGRAYVRTIYNNSTTGASVLEKWKVTSMGHAWSGGCSCELYSDPTGPDATTLMYDFFTAHPKP